MIDRRIAVAAAAVVIGVLGVRVATTGPLAPGDDTTQVDLGASMQPSPPPAPEGSTRGPLSESPATPNPTAPTTPTEASPTPTSTTGAIVPVVASQDEVADLVESRRPAIDQTVVPADHHHHYGQHSAHGGGTDVEHHAGELIVAGWSWRFDDPATRQRDAVSRHATSDVVALLAPSEIELQRRAAASEVSWVIIRSLAVAGNEVTVVFDHHIVGSGSPESVTSRSVVIVVENHTAIDMRL